jgi:hypothetical protein
MRVWTKPGAVLDSRVRAFAVGAWSLLVAFGSHERGAVAGRNDLHLLNLCPHVAASGALTEPVPECSWVRRGPNGTIQSIELDADAETRFRSLASELGAVLAPRLVIPADTLGWAGFQVSAELGTTTITQSAAYWDAVQGVTPQNRLASRPSGTLTTLGAFVRKGIWLPLPAMELGAGVVNVLDSSLVAFQGYAKLALHEGFHDWPIPSLAARGGITHLTGSDEMKMNVFSFDLLLSKAFGVLGTARLEPFGGWSYLLIRARSGTFDLTPACDAYATQTAAAAMSLGGGCAPSQRGTANDSLANFAFADQDVIVRQRFFGGLKVKFAWLFLAAQYEIFPAGRSRDERRANGARDTSHKQESLSLSGGVDF